MSCGALSVFHLSAIAIVLSNIIFGVSSGAPSVSHLSVVAIVLHNVIFGEASGAHSVAHCWFAKWKDSGVQQNLTVFRIVNFLHFLFVYCYDGQLTAAWHRVYFVSLENQHPPLTHHPPSLPTKGPPSSRYLPQTCTPLHRAKYFLIFSTIL